MKIDSSTRIIDLTVADLLEILGTVQTIKTENIPTKDKRLEYGIAGIARIFNCSITTANRIKSSGIIDNAISQCGRKIVVDAERALELMNKNKRR